jgi:hypothetical protein
MTNHEMREPPVEIYQAEIDEAVAKYFKHYPMKMVLASGCQALIPLPAHAAADVTIALDKLPPAHCDVSVVVMSYGGTPVTGLQWTQANVRGQSVHLVGVSREQTPRSLVVAFVYGLETRGVGT